MRKTALTPTIVAKPHRVMLCAAGAVVVEVDGRQVLLEDQGEPGPDHSGFDCPIRDVGGRVI